MNKCQKCGNEFEGNFCPKCGAKYEASKICPDCGTQLDTTVNFCNKCGHRFDTYENVLSAKGAKSSSGKSGANKAKEWFHSHKTTIKKASIALCSIAIVFILIFAVIVPIATNIFSANKLAKINLGDTKQQVEKILGESYGGNTQSNDWTYYSKNILKLYKQQEKIAAKAENITSFEGLEKLFEEELKLEEKIEKTTFKYINVTFDNEGLVSSVTYDAKCNKNSLNNQKKVKKTDIGEKNTIDVMDITNNSIPVKVTYDDGSYRLFPLPTRVEFAQTGEGSYHFPSTGTIFWEDSWGKYTQSVKFDTSNFRATWDFNGSQLYINGTMPKRLYDFFHMEYPWQDSDRDITGIRFGPDVEVIPSLADFALDMSKISSVTVDERNPYFYSVNNVVFDKDDNVVLNLSGGQVYVDDYNNMYMKNEQNVFVLTKSSSKTTELVLPFLEVEYIVSPEVANKYRTVSFDQSELWTRIPANFLRDATFESITLPQNIISIGKNALAGCKNLTNLTLPFVGTTPNGTENTHFGYIFGADYYEQNSNYIPSSLKTVIITSGSQISNYAFSGCSSLTSITISNSVTTIGEYAFENCSSLTSIELPNSVTSIGDYAFSGCSSLTSITIPDSVTEIGSSAFRDGSSLTSVTIGNSVTSIGDYAFYDCSSLTSVTIGNGVKTIGDSAFYNCSSLTSVTTPDSVTSIGRDAFNNCSSLTSVTIGNSVTTIGWYAFNNCSSLTSVTIGSSVTSIGSYAFRSCSSLTSVTVPDSVKTIGQYAFQYCSSLTSVTIGSSVITIYADAFNNCSSLTSVYYTGDVSGWCNISFGSRSANPLCYASNLYIDNQHVTELVIPETVTEIKRYAFPYYSSLTSVTIGNSVTTIGYEAFLSCSSLTSVTIGNSVTTIGQYAFRFCSSLTSITIPDSVTTIDRYAFGGCSSLTSVTIPNSVTTIGEYAFLSCSSLTSITISNSVTTIGEYAFYGCTRLTEIKFEGTVTQWKAIGKGSRWKENVPATKVICKDGEVNL